MPRRLRIDGPYVLLIRTTSTPKLLADSASWKSAVNKFKLFMEVIARW